MSRRAIKGLPTARRSPGRPTDFGVWFFHFEEIDRTKYLVLDDHQMETIAAGADQVVSASARDALEVFVV